MGNSSGKESRSYGAQRPISRHEHSSTSPGPASPPPHSTADRLNATYTPRPGRQSRTDLNFLGIPVSRDNGDQTPPETRRETKAEREARKLAKERELREKERERSLKEEGVDGGFLVTLGTYTGPEDFSKPVVRQLMLERRIAPFWRGLNDFSESWVEHQIVSAARGNPIPAADEIPADLVNHAEPSPAASSTNVNHLTVPITGRSQSAQSERSMNLSASHPAFSLPSSASPIGQSPSSSSPFFRGRAKTLAALSSTKNNGSQTDLLPQEIQMPKDPYVNGIRLEAYLYKDASECPICFLYYPPYLNKTRCCDQPICSECFVQIKRPDPHVPEHHDDSNDPTHPSTNSEDAVNLVSEPAACPYCAQPEFGVTYEPPPFRRGLAYAGGSHFVASAMSSTSSLHSGAASPATNRRRATSLSATAPGVITTDRVRPDWAKKLSDARAHAMRRAAAATALHNAAYVLGNQGGSEGTRLGFGRRRRIAIGGDSPNSSGRGTPRHGESSGLPGSILIPIDRNRDLELLERERRGESEDQNNLASARQSSRRRIEDIEELMVREAIRMSLATEEERKRKEEKEAMKEAKREEKKKAKDAKKAAKESLKSSLFGSTSAMASRSSLGHAVQGKGKEVDRSEDAPEVPAVPSPPMSTRTASQQHLQESRARLEEQVPDSPFGASVFNALGESSHRQLLRERSNNSSEASSIDESTYNPNSRIGASALGTSPASGGMFAPSGDDSDLSSQPTPSGNTSSEPMINFTSLSAAVAGKEEKETSTSGATHIERIPEHPVNVKPSQSIAGETSTKREQAANEPPQVPPGEVQEQQSTTTAPVVQAVGGNRNTFEDKPIRDVSVSNTERRVPQ
ncbi:hypothetical protein EJ05DRAFT_264380 [Pseudovirgaria hyperparasitica]|uniref:Protein sip5 n=1 Tax=Pseudovirgaria hyperparasitica TaxID=470096 RepID=A0A6A6WFD9_9PEZI|nr:uncharacterized protein EJ05DRAFT_264380 [Pseudovirgaria hyperparasitica]KAF2761443.1 hypothetical protein EJ05DRAFT_264380 [Pseudovirgaria hyperparasitica]